MKLTVFAHSTVVHLITFVHTWFHRQTKLGNSITAQYFHSLQHYDGEWTCNVLIVVYLRLLPRGAGPWNCSVGVLQDWYSSSLFKIKTAQRSHAGVRIAVQLYSMREGLRQWTWHCSATCTRYIIWPPNILQNQEELKAAGRPSWWVCASPFRLFAEGPSLPSQCSSLLFAVAPITKKAAYGRVRHSGATYFSTVRY